MIWSYAYSPELLPAIFSVILLAALGWYISGRRKVSGSRPLAIAAFLGVLWAAGIVLERAAVNPQTKILWFEFQGVWQLPLGSAVTWFVLRYAGLNRWLSRRNLILLAIPPALVLAIILTNGLHHLMWTSFVVDETVRALRGVAYWITLAYAFGLALFSFVVFVWLFVRSPRHRAPVAMMMAGQIANRTFIVLDSVEVGSRGPFDAIIFMFVVALLMYTTALFRFRIFDPIPLARAAVLEQMSEGMLVLDLQGRIVDCNLTAARVLGTPMSSLKGKALEDVLPACKGVLAMLGHPETVHREIAITANGDAKQHELNLTPLTDSNGEVLGQLLLLHDVTEQKRAQAKVLEQQRVVATLEERERLARELHDGVGQVLGYVGMQAQTARKWVQDGNTEKADSLLARLVEVAKDAHADVRESILSLKFGQAPEWSFLPTLKQYLDNFQANYGIHTDLSLSNNATEDTFGPAAGAQLLRVIQEALTNARKHGGAHSVRIAFERAGPRTIVKIADDGCGFDPAQPGQNGGSHFGLVFMRERMAEIGGSLKVESAPGAGTVIELDAPFRRGSEGSE